MVVMSGKRGRGRGSRLADLESLGIKPGDGVPPPILQPPGLYPPMERRPLDLSNTEADRYMLAVKQDHVVVAKQLPFYITRDTRHHDIHRYSNKYRSPHTLESLLTHIPLWETMLPKQLHFDKSRARKRDCAARKSSKRSIHDKKLIEKLSTLAEEEGEGSGESEGEDGNVTEDDFYDEELEEETGDYQLTYFDPGDGDDDEADALDGPSY